MAFPATPLDVEVSLALSADLSDPSSWVWTDITDYVREKKRISIKRGRSSERSTIPPSRCTLTVDNTDGRFCRFLPTGAWYGQIGKNTPLRVRVNNGSGYVTRFVGYVSGWPPTWDPSESDQTVSLVADGILRRLGQGRVLRSPLFRSIASTSPSVYYPLEDETDATNGASGLPGRAPLTGSAAFGGASLVPGGASAAMDLSAGGYLSAPTGLTAGAVASWEMEGVFGWETIPSSSSKANQVVGFSTPGSAVTEWGIGTFESAGTLRFGIYRISSGGVSLGFSSNPILAGVLYHFRIRMEQSGADVAFTRWLDGVQVGSGTEPGVTLYAPTLARVNAESSTTQMPQSISHVAAWVPVRSTFDTYLAVDGWAGELAHVRFGRLCAEEGIDATTAATTSQPMGPQGAGALVSELRACATTDFALMYEPADSAGLAFLSSSERYNRAAAITLQYDQGHVAPPWDPTDDDRDTRNDVTASRSGGSSARVTDETSIAAIGVYDDTISANTETDDQLNDVAGWAVNLGTVDELRWPAVKPNFLDHPSLIDDWMAADLGSQLHVTGHPSPLAPDEIEQIVEGYDETFGSYEYSVVANLSPASGWVVAELDDDDLGKLDTAGCVMQAAATSGATSFTVATTVLPRWTTDAGEMPIPILVSGQVNSVTAVANVSPAFVAAGTVAHASNASVTPTMPAGVQAGDLLLVLAAIRNSGTGTVDTPSGYTVLLTSGNMTVLGKVHTGTESAPTITFTGGVALADSSAQMAAFRGTGITVHASTAQLNASAQNIAYPALDVSRDNCVVLYVGWKQDDWTSVASPGTEIGEPDTTTGDDQGIVWAYTIQTTAAAIATGSFTVTGGVSAISRSGVIALATDVQTMTVTRGTNGVTKAIPIGSQVNVYRPARLAL